MRKEIISMIVFQLTFYVTIAAMIYGVWTLNWKILISLTLISLIQLRLKRSQYFVNFVNNFLKPREYFTKFERIFTKEIPKDCKKSLFCIHPHSVFAYANMNVCDDFSQTLVGLSSRFMLNLPIIGMLLRCWGIESVCSENLEKLMQNNANIALLPGGFEEATLTTPKELRVFIYNRKGFIKYCLRYGYTIYPVLIFGEHKAYATFDRFLRFRLLLNKLKIPAVLYWNPISQFLLPFNLKIVSVFGEPIVCDRMSPENLTQEIIDEVHTKYINELIRIHKEYHKEDDEIGLSIY